MSEPSAPAPVVTYWAISVFSSRTFWLNTAALTVAVLSATDVLTIIPARFLPGVSALVASLNIGLRLLTVRPVTVSAPGTLTPVAVEKLDPPAPLVTD